MKDNRTISKIIQQFWMTTSLRGVKRSIKSTSHPTRVFWGITMVCCLAMLIYQVGTLLVRYYQYFVTVTAYDQNAPPVFPDVTICNLNPYDLFATLDLSYSEYLKQLTLLREQVKKSSNISFDNDDDLWESLRTQYSYISTQNLYSEKFRPFDMNSSFIVDCKWFSWNFSPFTKDETGRDCKIKIKTFWDPIYYQCYNLYWLAADVPMGFSTILYLANFPDSLANVSSLNLGIAYSAGVRILIHSVNSFPLMLDQGIDASPGTQVTLGMSYKLLNHIVAPYSTCTTRSSLDPTDPQSYTYRQRGCLTTCRQQQYIDTCGCLAIFEGHTRKQLENYTYCASQILNQTNEQDVLKLMEQPKCNLYFWPSNSFCNCPSPCRERRYAYDVITTDWPNIPNQMAFYEKYIKPHPEIYGKRFDVYAEVQERMSNMTTAEYVARMEGISLIHDNFIQVNVKLKKPHILVNNDIPKVTWDTLFADLGGTLNLWMGVTILFAAEVIELLFTIVSIYCSRNHDHNA